MTTTPRQHPLQSIVLRCQSTGCNIPWMEVRIPQNNGSDPIAVVIARHGGDRHSNLMTLSDLERLLVEVRAMMQEAVSV